MESKERIIWIDFAKIVACVMVVVLHSISKGVKIGMYKPGLWIYYLGTFAIPLFLMVTGYLQMSREKVNYRYIMKKILNILIVVFGWTVGVYLIKLMFNVENNNFFVETVGSLIQKGTFSHFWYLGALIIIYMIFPILQKICKSKYCLYYVLLFIIINIIADVLFIYLYKKYNYILKNNIIQTFRIWIWILYILIGGILHKYSNNIKMINKQKLVVLTVICIAITVIYEILFSNILYGNMYAESFYSSPLVIVTSILIFVTISRFRFNNLFISKISSLTMGIYIVHILILNKVNNIMSFNNNYFSILNFLFTIIASLLITFIISRIPKLNSLIKI